MQADQSRFVTVFDGEGEANFASKKASKHFRITRYIKFQLKHKLRNNY